MKLKLFEVTMAIELFWKMSSFEVCCDAHGKANNRNCLLNFQATDSDFIQKPFKKIRMLYLASRNLQ